MYIVGHPADIGSNVLTMSNESLSNTTQLACPPPLLDRSLFGSRGGCSPIRPILWDRLSREWAIMLLSLSFSGLALFSRQANLKCTFERAIQLIDLTGWERQFRIPNYISVLSVLLCSFLLVSYAVLSETATQRHYLSIGLLVSVLLISLSFAIPVSANPKICFDGVTPNDMYSSTSCAWTGSLVTLGGMGCAIWVFFRSLWLHIRIFWDRDPGRKFKWASVIAGTVLPISLLVAVLTATGFSYRMGQTCFPNHENAIATFWVWLVMFAIAGFLLQMFTTGYCVRVYIRTVRRAERGNRNSLSHDRANQDIERWANVKRLFVLQWRNILVSVFTILRSIIFFIVFWTEDEKLGEVFHNPKNRHLLDQWIACQTLSMGDGHACRQFIEDLTVPKASVLASLILASLVGVEIFILLFRFSIIGAWRDLLVQNFRRFSSNHRPPSPQLTSLDNPERFMSIRPKHSEHVSAFSLDTTAHRISDYSSDVELLSANPLTTTQQRPVYERSSSDLVMFPKDGVVEIHLRKDRGSGIASSDPPTTPWTAGTQNLSPAPQRTKSSSSKFSMRPPSNAASSPRESNDPPIPRTKSAKLRGRISMPVPGTFVHVDGVDGGRTYHQQSDLYNAI